MGSKRIFTRRKYLVMGGGGGMGMVVRKGEREGRCKLTAILLAGVIYNLPQYFPNTA